MTLYDDRSRFLDRFGALLVLVVSTIVLSSLVSLSDPLRDRPHELGALVSEYSTAAMLLLALSAGGVARRWRVGVAVVLGVALLVTTTVLGVALVRGITEATVRDLVPPWSSLFLTCLATLVVVRRLLRHRRVTRATLLGAVSAYLLIPLVYFYAFLVIGAYGSEPLFGSWQPTTVYMYFSLATLTTISTGMEPVSDLGRFASTTEALVGQLYLVTFVAMVVGLLATRWRIPPDAR